ncbi:3-deoxy-D-manno-octulosonic acid transferase [Falsiroseomonas bella]|uniref:3-deoxy-D-manno-octulosonic acid transferase n=1 Tax=Falsiroseomonas bella TaxID=2184016 RepID=A0A317FK09_9PROT|nr:glycosyltransferase N-terminal domain-containing protein [Falsiroseomonas bella]PWS38407.1 3-deoxy-D-manno-octulosonic acid transferase [Falsiroseomonas bella]
MKPGPIAWRIGATLLAPLLPLHLARRARRGKEIAARLGERRGQGAARPPGRLFWWHAASVGETGSMLPVLGAMAARDPALHFLVTTGTVTSAELLAQRLPAALAPRVAHRFVPLDVPAWTARFLRDWRPDAGAFVESELWPNLLAEAQRRAVPLALVNARMSARSAARWRRAPGLARQTLGAFQTVLARSEEDAARLRGLGLPQVLCWGDVKTAAAPLPADPAALEALRTAIGDRPVFLAASTHPGEEALALAAHRALAPEVPGLLTILVPRHPERGAPVAAEAGDLPTARRGAGELPGPGTAIYVADTLGELGLFYRLARVALVGGSLVPHGGQNPLEPARLGCPILVGPHTRNFAEAMERLLAAGGALRLPDAAALAPAIRDVLSDPGRARAIAEAAAAVAEGRADLPERLAEALLGLLPPPDPPAETPAEGRRTGFLTNEV